MQSDDGHVATASRNKRSRRRRAGRRLIVAICRSVCPHFRRHFKILSACLDERLRRLHDWMTYRALRLEYTENFVMVVFLLRLEHYEVIATVRAALASDGVAVAGVV